MQRSVDRKKHLKTTPYSPVFFIIAGLGWTVAFMAFLILKDGTSSAFNSIFLQLPLFYVGSLLVSYGIVQSAKDTFGESASAKWIRITLFAVGVTVASFVIYGWLQLLIIGL